MRCSVAFCPECCLTGKHSSQASVKSFSERLNPRTEPDAAFRPGRFPEIIQRGRMWEVSAPCKMSEWVHVRKQQDNVWKLPSGRVDVLMRFLTCDGRETGRTKYLRMKKRSRTRRRQRRQLGKTRRFQSFWWRGKNPVASQEWNKHDQSLH